MQKEILKGLLAVKGFKHMGNAYIEQWIFGYTIVIENGSENEPDYWESLPPGSWQLLGRVSEISEEVAATLVERWDSGIWNDYSRHLARVNTATESLASLLRSHGFEPEETVLLKADVNNS